MMRQLEFRRLGVRDYGITADEMRTWTQARTPEAADEIWFLEHAPVYTQGVSCSESVREGAPDIPLVKSDRGGQITYHGPGQLVAYLLLDLRRPAVKLSAPVLWRCRRLWTGESGSGQGLVHGTPRLRRSGHA